MLLLILIDVQYSQKAIFSFKKGLNCQDHSSSGSFHPVNLPPPSKISDSPPLPPSPLTTIWNTLIHTDSPYLNSKEKEQIYI